MDGTSIIGELMQGNAALTAVVPAEQMKSGRLPDGAPLPSILARSESEVERITLARESRVHITERIAVTVRAGDYRSAKAIDRLVREACAGFVGEAAGLTGVSVLPAGRGPDLNGPGGTYERTRDFRVSYFITT
jgi:hypothetical protein